MSRLMQDFRYACRMLRRAPGFAATAILTLALGIGANTAIFSIVSPMLFEPLPFPHAERIVQVAHVYHGEVENGLEGAEALYLLEHQQAFSAAAVVDSFGDSNLSGAGLARRVSAVRVSHGFFAVWGAAPARGRDFTAADDAPGATPTAILSDGLWRSQFGAEPGVVGQSIRLNDRVYVVIGVMPTNFTSLEQNDLNPEPVDLWTDLQPTEAGLAPLGPNLDVIGRLAPGCALPQAQSELDAEKAGFNQTHPGIAARMGWGARGYQKALAADSRAPLLLLLGAVGLVLLIACANLASLLLARAAGRRREMAIRAAVGANPARLARQLLTESLLLAGLGAGLGWWLAWWSVPALARLAPAEFALPMGPRLDADALWFTLALAAATGILFGLAPALEASRPRLRESLQEGGGGGQARAGRARAALVVAEVALAFLLLAGAGLLAASLLKLNRVNPGFSTAGVLTAQTTLSGARLASDAAATRYAQQVVAQLRQLPGVAAAASITGVPLTRAMNYPVAIPGRAEDRDSDSVEWRAISPDFFRALRIPLTQGRPFDDGDTASGAKVAIISQAFARRYWPGRGAVGEAVEVPDPGGSGRSSALFQIVGVAADVRENGVDAPPPLTLYVPQAQASDAINALVNHWFALGFVIRAADGVSAASLAPGARRAFAAVDAGQPAANLIGLEALKGNALGRYRFMAALLEGFAGLALLLGGIGIYGLLSYAVAQRSREIGIRMALGASRNRLLRQVVGEGLRLAALGLGLGMLGALFLNRLLAGFLFGVAPTDPAVWALGAGALLLLAALASLRPAWRATQVDPLQSLRAE